MPRRCIASLATRHRMKNCSPILPCVHHTIPAQEPCELIAFESYRGSLFYYKQVFPHPIARESCGPTQVHCDRIVGAGVAVDAGLTRAICNCHPHDHPTRVAACRWGENGDNIGNAAAIRLQSDVNVVSSHSSMLEGLAARLQCECTAA